MKQQPEEQRTIQELGRALENRTVIGEAKGLLMEREGISSVAAFQMLVVISQDTNEKLSKIAQQLVEDHHKQVRKN